MKKSRIKSKLSKNEPVLSTTLHLNDPSIFELVSLMGIDGVWIDLEHQSRSLETAAQMMRALRCGSSDAIARAAKGEFPRISRLLEAGAQGIIYPRCDNAEEAKEVVKWMKFYPAGKRGVDGAGPDMPYCSIPYDEYIRKANEETFLMIQLEDPNAIEEAEAIASVEGVDGIVLGPADFCVASGIDISFTHEKMNAAVEAVSKAASNTNKHWGAPVPDIHIAKSWMEKGARFFWHSADLLFIKNAVENMLKDFRSIGFDAGNLDYIGSSYLEK